MKSAAVKTGDLSRNSEGSVSFWWYEVSYSHLKELHDHS